MKRRISFHRRVVIITGGSRGLGLVLARQLAREGAKLVLIARDAEELVRAERQITQLGGEVHSEVADVTVRAEVERAVENAIAHFGTVDVLINDAGIIQVGPFEHMDIEDFEAAMKVHFWGALHATRAVLPTMKRKRFGRIVNIASIGGEIAVPHLAPYVASKFALVGLSDALRAELVKDGIFVTTVCPTLMRTGSPRKVELKGRARDELAWFSAGASLPGLSIDAERAARRILQACRYGAASTFVSSYGRIASVIVRVAPELSADLLRLVNRALPSRDPHEGTASTLGRELLPELHGGVWTRKSDEAAVKNNEI